MLCWLIVSSGCSNPHSPFLSALLCQALNARGILMTASAGNDGLNTDSNPHVPSTLTTPNLIAVAATQQGNTLWSGSNFGKDRLSDQPSDLLL